MSRDGRDFQSRSQAAPRGVEIRNSVDLGGFFAILRRRRFWIVAGFAITLGLAFLYITLSPLIYTSTISILIDARDRQPAGSDQTPLPQTADPIMVESQLKLMTSEAVLRRVAISEHLESDPEFSPSEHGGLISSLLELIQRGAVTQPAMQHITDTLFERIAVKRPDRTYVVDMDVKASSPGKAARLADAIAKAFIEEERAAADSYTQDQSNWVVQRTNELRGKVELAEKRVQDYKAANGIVDVAGTLSDEQQLQDANRDLVAARSKAGEAQARVDQIRRIIASGKALDGTYDTINSTVIRQLRVQYSDLVRRQAAASQKYGTLHPEYRDIEEQLSAVKGQIAEEMQRISSALTNEAQVARGNADDALKRVKTLEARTTDTNQTSLRLKELQRQADGERTNYEKTPYARIVAPASIPAKPSSPKIIAALLIALSGGLSLGIGLAVVRDYVSGTSANATMPTTAPHIAVAPGPGPDFAPETGPDPDDGPGRGPGPGHAAPAPEHEAGALDPRHAAPILKWAPKPQSGVGLGSMRTLVSGRRDKAADGVEPEPIHPPMDGADAPPAEAVPQVEPVARVAAALDPRDLLSSLLADIRSGITRRIVLTAHAATAQKTELALTLAKSVAARGSPVLVIDGDSTDCRLSRLASAEGLPARIHFDRMELFVLGIPSLGDGVVFVLPDDAVTGDLTQVEAPFIACEIRAVIVDGPPEGQALARFGPIADRCYSLDDQGYLHAHGVTDSARQIEPEQFDMDPSHFARGRTT
jgi:uncharacterized protein involved in exopolysaccharide biosynthesis